MHFTGEALATESRETKESRESWGDVAVAMAGDIAGLIHRSRGDLAELRRMDPEDVVAPVFWQLLARHDMPNLTEDRYRKWGLIVHGIALMTPSNVPEGGPRTAHTAMPVGRTLYLGSDSHRGSRFYSELRLNRLLTSRGQMQRILLARLFRMCAANGVSFDWREMAWFILNEGHNEEEAEKARMQIAREYYRAERRYSQTPSNNEDQ